MCLPLCNGSEELLKRLTIIFYVFLFLTGSGECAAFKGKNCEETAEAEVLHYGYIGPIVTKVKKTVKN